MRAARLAPKLPRHGSLRPSRAGPPRGDEGQGAGGLRGRPRRLPGRHRPGACGGGAAAPPERVRRGEAKVRVLVAFEDARGVYREAIARALAELRPDLEVRCAPLVEMGRERGPSDPHVVVCSRPNGEHPGGRGAWVQVPTEDGATDEERLARGCLNGGSWRTDGPALAGGAGGGDGQGGSPRGGAARGGVPERGRLEDGRPAAGRVAGGRGPNGGAAARGK